MQPTTTTIIPSQCIGACPLTWRPTQAKVAAISPVQFKPLKTPANSLINLANSDARGHALTKVGNRIWSASTGYIYARLLVV